MVHQRTNLIHHLNTYDSDRYPGPISTVDTCLNDRFVQNRALDRSFSKRREREVESCPLVVDKKKQSESVVTIN